MSICTTVSLLHDEPLFHKHQLCELWFVMPMDQMSFFRRLPSSPSWSAPRCGVPSASRLGSILKEHTFCSAMHSRSFDSFLFDICFFTTCRGGLVQDQAQALIWTLFFYAPPLRKYNPHTGPLEELTPLSTGRRFSEMDRAGDVCFCVCDACARLSEA